VAPVDALGGATCPRHAGVLAVDLCERCGRFVCGDCVSFRGEKTWCSECALQPAGASTRATGALIVAVAGFFFCVPLSLLAIVLGRLEQLAIERGEAPPDGLGRARWALRLGVIQVVLFTLTVIALIVLGNLFPV